MIVADSDVLIDALRGRERARSRIATALQTGTLATTVVSLFELLSGARTKSQQHKVQQLLGALEVLPVDARASREAAAIRRDLEFSGQGIGMADYLIAGICRARGAVLLTRNLAHFERVDGLLVETPG
ncbi:type II toxin-antitoxin system VapC family toxin [Planctomycetota bacterium]